MCHTSIMNKVVSIQELEVAGHDELQYPLEKVPQM